MMTPPDDNHKPALQVTGLQVSLGGHTVLRDVAFSIPEGESLAIVGASGSGKTTLVKALANQIFYRGEISYAKDHPKLFVIARQHQFNNLSNRSDFYYQQRFNSFDADDSRTVMEELLIRCNDPDRISVVLDRVGIGHKADTRLIQLSNGEHKRFQVAEALLEGPDWILLDSPYIGLDAGARQMLNTLLDELMRSGVQLVLVSSHAELPSGIGQVLYLEGGTLHSETSMTKTKAVVNDADQLKDIPSAYTYPSFAYAVRMEDVTIRYGEKTILDGIQWEVRRGECWSVSGHNGAGKSTLLSLINGDNPQAFSQRIWLFDQRKGSGESIWDIKRMIGYISPELHHYFESGADALEIVASGLFDTMGLFRMLHPDHEWLSLRWMKVLGIDMLARRPFSRLSDSEQRRVLLARALVKHPPMLILDEPCQGMDAYEADAFKALINDVCTGFGKTLIYVSHVEKDIPPCVTQRMVLREGRIFI